MDQLLQKGIMISMENEKIKLSPFMKNKEKKEEEKREVVLSIKDLHKSYGKKEVLKGINLEVYKGEVFGFIGKNGAGKSTTIDCIVGLKDFNSGEIVLAGHNVKENPLDAKMELGYVPSEPVTYEVMTGNEYPHGMKQKVCLMASLIHNPTIWILDEPTVGLDIIVYQTLMDMLREFAANGKTVFITSHNIDLVSRICNRVAIINNGVVAELIDFSKEPLKRRNLSNIFFSTYAVEKKPE